jgi:hypothetical protein
VNHFIPLEDCRDAISPMRVLHVAVSEGEVARTGPLMPLVDAELTADQRHATGSAARLLAQAEARFVQTSMQ